MAKRSAEFRRSVLEEVVRCYRLSGDDVERGSRLAGMRLEVFRRRLEKARRLGLLDDGASKEDA